MDIDAVRIALENPNRKVRESCLTELGSTVYPANWDSHFYELLAKCFDDKVEGVRERALKLVINTDCNLDNITVALLFKAVHKRALIETSEVIKMLLIKLLSRLMLNTCIEDCGDQIIEVLQSGLTDPSPDVLKECCESVSVFAKSFPKSFRDRSDHILQDVLNVVKHRHYKVRVIAITTLADIVLHGNGTSVDTVCGTLGESMLDQNPRVRAAVMRTSATWLLTYRDRYSHFDKMLPLLLTMLLEETEEYRQEAQHLWNKIGFQYLEENEKTYKEKAQFLPQTLVHYPKDVIRPNLGCRILVKNHMIRIIPAIIRELGDWITEVRIKSAELLKIIVLHAEHHIVQFVEKILPSMCKASLDKEDIVSRKVIEAAELMGYFIAPNIYLNLMTPQMKESQSLGHFIILASLLKNNEKSEIASFIHEISVVVCDSDICEIRDKLSQEYLSRIIAKLLDCCDSNTKNDEYSFNIYVTIISVMSLGSDEIQALCSELICKLSAVFEFETVSNMNRHFIPRIFIRLLDSCGMWLPHSIDFNLFITLIHHYIDDILNYVSKDLLHILTITLNLNFDREVNFKILSGFVKLFESSKITAAETREIMEEIFLNTIKQQLVWKAGKVMEVVRGTAMTAILMFIQQFSNTLSLNFISQMIFPVLGLCEDSYLETRICSLESISCMAVNEKFPKLAADVFIKCITVVVDRLNDKNANVRTAAVQALKLLFSAADRFDDFEVISRNEEVIKSMKIILIHADDRDECFRRTVLKLFEDARVVKMFKATLPEDILTCLSNKYTNSEVAEKLNLFLKF